MNYFKTHPMARVTAILTPILLICVILMGYYSPKQAPEGFKSFILAFEFAKTPEEISLLFENFSIENFNFIDMGIYIDFGFMVAYSLLLAIFFIKSAEILKQKWLLLGIPLSIVIFFGDFFENIILLKITQIGRFGIDDISLTSLLEKLHFITWIKWGGLALAFIMISIALIKGNWLSKIGALVCLSPFLLSFFALNNSPAILSIFTQSVFASFAVLIFYSFLFQKTYLNE